MGRRRRNRNTVENMICYEKAVGGWRCLINCGNWSVMVEPRWQGGRESSHWECCLWNCKTHLKVPLPRLLHDPDTFSKGVLASSPTGNHFAGRMVFFFSEKLPFFIFALSGSSEGKWQTYNYSYYRTLIYDAIAPSSGNIYAIGSNGVFAKIVIERPFRVVPHWDFRVPRKSSLYNKQQIVNYGQDFFIVQRKSLLDLEVWKMEVSGERWERVWDLGDLAFFSSAKYCRAFSGLEWGIQGNRVYFMDGDDDDSNNNLLYVFCLGDESLSVSSIPIRSWGGAFWCSDTDLMHLLRLVDSPPKHARIITKVEKKVKKRQESTHEDSYFEIDGSIFSILPVELQKRIAQFVVNNSVKDYMSLRSVCRGWKSLAPPIRWRSDPTGSTSIECWLMVFQGEKSLCSFYDPVYNSTYYMNSTELLGCQIRFSKDGWLLVSQGSRSVFFFELFSRTKIKLPDLVEDYCFDGISFSTSPISSDWVIFAISHKTPMVVDISYIKAGDENWTTSRHDNRRPFASSGSNPVFYDQCFYCLGKEGSLGTFRLTEAGGSWLIRAHPEPSEFLLTTSRGYLVSFKENLFSVFVGHMGKSVQVFQLNASSTEWVLLTNLGCQLFFFSQTSSLAVPAIGETLKNTINFPTFACSSNNYIFYSLENSRFEVLGGDYSTEDLCDAKELLRATWMHPRVIRTIG